ncbi:MAG: TIGR03986 family CRISPR-associated RAMP protein [Propionibacteriaceae bacterium]|jgi:CRISPR-associated protein (TIGR03986 family)|nr:TIGR03986 family CRISPR-associated RAMP protein [Propionibacteriaceae bacterium]
MTYPRKVTDHDGFINPYNFIHLPDGARADLPPECADTAPADILLGEGLRAAHGVAAPGTYCGVIPIFIRAKTPILLPDQAAATGLPPDDESGPSDEGRVFSMRQDPDGHPLLLGSSVKGMLRSMYEIVTSSRFGAWDKSIHQQRGAARMTTQAAVAVRLGMVREKRDGVQELGAQVLKSFYPRNRNLLPYDANKGRSVPMVHIPSLPGELGRKAGDGRSVEAWLCLRHHQRGQQYAYWRVEQVEPVIDGKSTLSPTHPPKPEPMTGHSPVLDGGEPCWVKVQGVVHINGSKFSRKHDERLFPTDTLSGGTCEVDLSFEPGPDDNQWLPIDEEARASWDHVIESYRPKRADSAGTESQQESYSWGADSWTLKQNRTFFCRLGADRRGSNRIEFMSPVMIGREPFSATADELLPARYRPAGKLGELSPADRVFGWVAEDGQSNDGLAGWKGLVAIDPPQWQEEGKGIRKFEEPIQLAILAEPKTSQYRFYSADAHGRPSGDGDPKSSKNGFGKDDQLRGRKVYLPQPDVFGDDKYWSTAPRSQRARIREFERWGRSNGNVAYSVSEWIEPGTVFTTTVRFEGLNRAELGALLYLLDLRDGDHEGVFGLGGGKPLGFGAVRVQADWGRAVLSTAEQSRRRYTSLLRDDRLCLSNREREDLAVEFETYFKTVTVGRQKLLWKEFMDAVFGFKGAATHYPRTMAQQEARQSGLKGAPKPRGESDGTELFRWWTANEQQIKPRSLPLLGQDQAPTLPYLDGGRDRGGQQ